MIYIALAFLDGILIIYNKPLAIMLAGLLLLILTRKKPPILLTIFILCQSIISNYWFSNYNFQQKIESNWFKDINNLNEFVELTDFRVKNNKYVAGDLKFKGHTLKFFYFPRKKQNLTNFERLPRYSTCFVNGKLKIDESFSDQPTAILKNINLSTCKADKSKNISQIIATHKQYSLKRLQRSSSHWQNTFALVTEDVSYIDGETLDIEKELGIYHLLAVSSSHVAVIAGIFYFTLNRFNVPKAATQCLIIIALFLFAYYTNFAPSALRAILCLSFVMILPKKFYSSLLDILSLVFLMLCTFSPDIIFDIGFQFSFLITLFILLSAPLIKTLNKIQSAIAITFIAQISSFIISAYYFNQIQWIGFFSNFLFIPYYSFILFPLAIFTYIYIQFFNSSIYLNNLIKFFYTLHDQYFIKIFSHFNQYRWFIGEFNQYHVVLVVAWMIATVTILTKGRFKSSLIVFIIGSLFFTSITTKPHTRFTALNVGQGDSFLFETNYGHRVLIDTGGKADQEGRLFKFGQKKLDNSNSISKYHIMPTLKKRGISKLDYIIITHPHADHIGELEYLLQHIKVKGLIINFASYPQDTLNSIKTSCNIHHIKLLNALEINQVAIDESKVQFLDAFHNENNDLNEHSIMAIIKTPRYNILTTGDATINNEAKLLKNYSLPKIDILKVGHHGSKTSSSKSFIEKVHPDYSVISSGKNNVYKLPNKEVIERLRSINSKTYNTQVNGEITFDLEKDIKVITEH